MAMGEHPPSNFCDFLLHGHAVDFFAQNHLEFLLLGRSVYVFGICLIWCFRFLQFMEFETPGYPFFVKRNFPIERG